MTDRAQQIGNQAGQAEADQHEGDRQVARMARGARRRRQRGPQHSYHDHRHGDVLGSACVLAEHALSEEHQEDEPRRERGLDHDEGGEQQCDHLQRPSEDRQRRAEEPARAGEQPAQQRDAQVLVLWRLLRIGRLKRDP